MQTHMHCSHLGYQLSLFCLKIWLSYASVIQLEGIVPPRHCTGRYFYAAPHTSLVLRHNISFQYRTSADWDDAAQSQLTPNAVHCSIVQWLLFHIDYHWHHWLNLHPEWGNLFHLVWRITELACTSDAWIANRGLFYINYSFIIRTLLDAVVWSGLRSR